MKKLLALLLVLVLGASCAMAESPFIYDNSKPFSLALYQENWQVYLNAMGQEDTYTWQNTETLENMVECVELSVNWVEYDPQNPDNVVQVVVYQNTTMESLPDDMSIFCGSMVVSMAPVALACGMDPDALWEPLWAENVALLGGEPVVENNALVYTGTVCGIPVRIELLPTSDTEAIFFGYIDLSVAK